MAQWRTSRGGQYDRDRVRNRPALHERHGRSGARFVRAIPDSCWNFPIGARHSRFVLKFPDSCARFPIGARDSQSRSWAGCRVGRIAPPPRLTWSESLQRFGEFSRLVLEFPDWCFWRIGTGLACVLGHEPSREAGCHEPQRPRGRPFAGGYSVPVCAVFRWLSNSLSIPPKEILS